jgi:hypothetical protein
LSVFANAGFQPAFDRSPSASQVVLGAMLIDPAMD